MRTPIHAILLLILVTMLAGCAGSGVASSTDDFPRQTGFVQRSVRVDGVERTVWVFVPPGYTPRRMYPAILFLHGLFEQGNGGTNVLSAGLGPVIANNPERWPFITIFPQSDGTWHGLDRERLALAALNGAMKHYTIDPDRVILAGLSFGGLGVWEIGARNNQRFAALVSVSGPSDVEAAPLLAAVPSWTFASEADVFVHASNSEEMCRAIQDRGGRARLTTFPGAKHDCWSLAVEQSDLVGWMLRQRRNPLAAAGGTKYQNWGRLRSWSQ